jgi:hypothetical protein
VRFVTDRVVSIVVAPIAWRSPEGHLFCKGCIFENLLAQKQEIKGQLKKYDAQQASEQVETQDRAVQVEHDKVNQFYQMEQGVLPQGRDTLLMAAAVSSSSSSSVSSSLASSRSTAAAAAAASGAVTLASSPSAATPLMLTHATATAGEAVSAASTIVMPKQVCIVIFHTPACAHVECVGIYVCTYAWHG